MNSQQMMEEIDRLARLCEAKDAEIAKLKGSFAEIQHNQATLIRDGQQQLSEAQSQIAMQANATIEGIAQKCAESIRAHKE